MARPIITNTVPTYVPEWTGVFEAWSKNWVKKHFWRVKNVLHTKEDALQECALVWAKCAARYSGSVNNPAWFMSLYTCSVARHWHTLSNNDSAAPSRYQKDLPLTFTGDQEALFNDAADLPAGFLAAQLANASAELGQLFSTLADAPAELLAMLFAEGDDLAINARICRFLRFTKGTNVVAELRGILTD